MSTNYWQVVTVKEEWIAISILRLVEGEKAVVEGAGATALAAILAGELQELKGKRCFVDHNHQSIYVADFYQAKCWLVTKIHEQP